MNKFCKCRVRGSYTIEAALIFPLVLFIIISLIYLGFYLHDCGKVQAILDECQVKGKGLVTREVDLYSNLQSYSNYLDRGILYPIDNNFKYKESQISNYIYKTTRDKLFISNVSNVEAQVSLYKIELKVGLNFKFPFAILETFFAGSKETIIQTSGRIHNPTNFIRGFQVSHDLVKKVDLVNEVTNKLKKIVEKIK